MWNGETGVFAFLNSHHVALLVFFGLYIRVFDGILFSLFLHTRIQWPSKACYYLCTCFTLIALYFLWLGFGNLNFNREGEQKHGIADDYNELTI